MKIRLYFLLKQKKRNKYHIYTILESFIRLILFLYIIFFLMKFSLQLTRKSSTWQVMLQSRKSRELTVNPYSCGSYDLIWYNALHLTNIAGLFETFYKVKKFFKNDTKKLLKNKHQAVHGCRQFVFWYVRLSPRTNVTPWLNLHAFAD